MGTNELADHCVELLATLGPARAKRMFGGHGLYVDGLFVGLVTSHERLYLKADEAARPRFEAAGCEPFRYERDGVVRTMWGWWSAPAEAMESPTLMAPWARLALQAALQARANERPPAARKTPARKTAVAKKTAVKPRAAPKTRRAAPAKAR